MNTGFQQDYPASVETLWQVFGQPDYPQRKYKAQGITAYAVREFTASAETITLDLTRTLSIPADRIPALVRKFLHPEQTLHYISHWQRSGPDAADFDLEIIPLGLPVHVTGKGRLRQTSADSTRLSIDFTVTVNIPLIRHKVESMVAAQIEKSFRDDHAFTLRYIAENA